MADQVPPAPTTPQAAPQAPQPAAPMPTPAPSEPAPSAAAAPTPQGVTGEHHASPLGKILIALFILVDLVLVAYILYRSGMLG